MSGTKVLPKQIANKIIEYIVRNDLPTGEKLPNEFELAELLNVGRSTVREAVKSLTTRNILEVRQGAGTFVSNGRLGVFDDPLGFAFIKDKHKLIMDLLEVRIIIEPRIAAMAAFAATKEDIAELQHLCKEVERLIAQEENHMIADIALHTKLAESSGNIVVPNLLPIIQNAISLFVTLTNQGLRQETIENHRMIVDAIAARDANAASEAMLLHLIYNRNVIRKQPNYKELISWTPKP